MNNSKTIFTIVITALITALVVGSGVFMWQQKVAQKEIQQAIEKVKTEVSKQNSQSDISNWQTYTNKYYQYQISIPADWTIEEVDHNNDPIVRLSSPDKKIIMSSRADDVSINGGGGYGDVVTMKAAQVGTYSLPRDYQTTSFGYSIVLHSNNVSHPLNIHLPDFRIAIKGDLEKNDPIILQILKTFKNTGTLKSLEDLIEYSIPSGWRSTIHAQGVNIQSPDYIESVIGVTPEKGGLIDVLYFFSLPGHTLESEKNSWRQTAGVSDISDTSINGTPAFKSHVNYEGHVLDYYVIKNGYGFYIAFYFPNLAEEKKHQKQINEFLNSIRFK